MPEKEPNKVQAEISYSQLEYTAIFSKPIWGKPANPDVIGPIYDALVPFGFTLEGVETTPNSQKLSELAVAFRRTPPGLTFTIGLGKLHVAAENVAWNEAEQLTKCLKAGSEAVVNNTKALFQSQHVSLAMHIQLKTHNRTEIALPLLSPLALGLMDGEIKFPGVLLQRKGSSITIDASIPLANGLFVRITREHSQHATFEQMTQALLKDEKQLFDALRIDAEL
jgi:hypothetical protein